MALTHLVRRACWSGSGGVVGLDYPPLRIVRFFSDADAVADPGSPPDKGQDGEPFVLSAAFAEDRQKQIPWQAFLHKNALPP
ncbi:MAG: hypothetical protein CMK32_02050 [Porticoccaceae bacterium]|nr:hypothetical protein [Porticoccaceae bacterium]